MPRSVQSSHPVSGAGAPPRPSRAETTCTLLPNQREMDLRARNFDGLVLEHIDFSGSDLRGANLSECVIRDCSFAGADLVDVCLAESMIEGCDFFGARFGGTMIEGARFIACCFAGPSALMLAWHRDHFGPDNIWVMQTGRELPFMHPPVVVTGLPGTAMMAVLAGQVVWGGAIRD